MISVNRTGYSLVNKQYINSDNPAETKGFGGVIIMFQLCNVHPDSAG
ncbi:hypothetical protein ACFP3I_02320 [Chryseobacterium arachidis]